MTKKVLLAFWLCFVMLFTLATTTLAATRIPGVNDPAFDDGVNYYEYSMNGNNAIEANLGNIELPKAEGYRLLGIRTSAPADDVPTNGYPLTVSRPALFYTSFIGLNKEQRPGGRIPMPYVINYETGISYYIPDNDNPFSQKLTTNAGADYASALLPSMSGGAGGDIEIRTPSNAGFEIGLSEIIEGGGSVVAVHYCRATLYPHISIIQLGQVHTRHISAYTLPTVIYSAGTGEGENVYDGMHIAGSTQSVKSNDSMGFYKVGASFSGWKLYYNQFYDGTNFVNDYLNYDSTMIDQNTNYTGDGTETVVIPADFDVIFVAQWETDILTVKFDKNGHGEINPDDQNVEYNNTANEPDALSEAGYTFGGWYIDPACTEEYAFSTPVTEDITLYAKWTPIDYTVSYVDGFNGKLVFPNQVYEGLHYGDKTPEFVGVPLRKGFIFVGWSPAVENNVTKNATYVAKWIYVGVPGTLAGIGTNVPTNPDDLTMNLPEIITPDDLYNPTTGGQDNPTLNLKDHYSYIVGMPDGNVHPEADLTRAEAVTIFFRLLTDETRDLYWSTENIFNDVSKDDWYNNAISTCANMGIVNGYDDGNFNPTSAITRAEFAKIAVSCLSSLDTDSKPSFNDVDESAWYAKYVSAAEAAGVIKGYNGEFRPDDTITRAEACAIVNRLLGRAPHKDNLLKPSTMITWPDNKPDNWYYADIQEATNSHDYSYVLVENVNCEMWTVKLDQRNWPALELEWSNSHSAPFEGEVFNKNK